MARLTDSGRPAAGRYAALTVVREGDGYVLGGPAAEDFVAVPEIGGRVVLWLQDGVTPEECADRAAELAGEPVDVAGFIDGLAEAGLLAPDDTAGLAEWKRTAGRLLFDGATIGVLAVVELTLPAGPAAVAHLIRAGVLLNISAIAFQFLIFLRTDVYALFVLATGCKHLWATKGAIARQTIGRATAGDRKLLGSVSRREIGWARVFLCLYLPGVVFTAWYFVVFALPAVRKLITMSARAAFSGGAPAAARVAGGIALLITAASLGYILWGLARTMIRVVRQLSWR